MGIAMSTTFAAADRHTEAFTRIDSSRQAGLALLGVVSGQQQMPIDLVRQATFGGCLSAAAQHCGKDDQQIAVEIAISQGYMSRAMRTVWAHWAKRLVAFMQVTNSVVPLQWIADQVGCDIKVREHEAARVRELEEELRRLRGGRAA
jgi:hypothetical protein